MHLHVPPNPFARQPTLVRPWRSAFAQEVNVSGGSGRSSTLRADQNATVYVRVILIFGSFVPLAVVTYVSVLPSFESS